MAAGLRTLIECLITRSSGSLRKLCVSRLSSDQSFFCMADHAKSLQDLRLPKSEMCDSIVEQVAERLTTLTFLDVSFCINIGAPALEAIGKHCKSLTGLRRIMDPSELVIAKLSQDDEALAIAATMPKLKHLEMAYLLINTESVFKILSSCPELELLDVRGCWNVRLDEKLVKEFTRLKIVGPLVVDCHEMNGWDDCSSYSGSSHYLAWDFDMDDYDDDMQDGFWEDDHSMEDVEMEFYDGFDYVNAGFDWPQYP